MTRYSVQSRDRIFVKSNTSNTSYISNTFDHAKESATDAFKTASKRAIP